MSSAATTPQVRPWFITGFTDAECCFYVGITKSTKVKTKWEVQPSFKIELHIKDLELLRLIQNYLKVGNIKIFKDKATYYVNSLKDLEIIINNFEHYPLLSKKYGDYILFKTVVNMMLNGEHLTIKGVEAIINIRASMNRGLLSDKLKASFTDVVPSRVRSIVESQIPHPQWVAGFTSPSLARASWAATQRWGLFHDQDKRESEC